MTPTPDRAALAQYLDMIFGYIDGAEHCIALRGTGEKGTTGEGAFIEPVIVPGIQSQFDIDRIFGHVQRWSQHGRASFIVPAAVDNAALAPNDHHATEDRIKLLTTMMVDIDKGDTIHALQWAQATMGQASMVVYSGGTTETGHPKIHAYWKLSEPSDQVAAIAAARKMLALKIGGDPSFGRSTQVVRLPGSLYGKGGVVKPCMISEITSYEYDLDDILQAVSDMPTLPGLKVDQSKLQPMLTPTVYSGSGGLNFSGFKSSGADLGHDKADIKVSLTAPIHEGGDDDRNRWSEFNRVAGLHIHQVRTGHVTLDEARELTRTWMEAKMSPPWPPVRFESEWKALVNLDARHKGALPGSAIAQQNQQVIDANPNGVGVFTTAPISFEGWAVADWTMGEKPKRRFLVDGLIMCGKSHMLAAEGGAGKTFLLLDLALKLASHTPDQEQQWCGMPLSPDAGGTVVMFTTEDDKDELHIRMTEIDKDGRRAMAGNKLVIIPTINIGGAFPLVEKRGGNSRAEVGATWKQWLERLSEIKDLRMVVIDTLNTTLHGEENNATVINEYIQAASETICGKLGAALVVTHHVRKPSEKTKIYTPEDMKNSIRGSTALIGAFRVALGIWHAPDYKERLEKIGQEPKRGRLFNFAVVKANNPEMCFETRTMLRQPSGLLLDITDSEKKMAASTMGQVEAWMVKAAAYAAEVCHPFTIKAAKKRPPNGRKHQLPAMVQNLTERDVEDLCDRLIADGRLAQCNLPGSKTYSYLDVPDGPLARGVGADGGVYRMDEGADFKPPSWEHLFAYHPVEGRIVRRGDEASRMVGGGQKAPASEARKPAGWNPNDDPEMMAPGGGA